MHENDANVILPPLKLNTVLHLLTEARPRSNLPWAECPVEDGNGLGQTKLIIQETQPL